MAHADSDTIAYVIVVQDTDLPARKLFCEHFANYQGGANPSTLRPYSSVPCKLSELGGHLEWITSALANQYTDIRISISVYTPRNWADYDVPEELLKITRQYNLSLNITFSSPAKRLASGVPQDT